MVWSAVIANTSSGARCAAALVAAILLVPPAAAGETFTIPVPRNVIYAGQTIGADLIGERKVPVGYLERVSVMTERAAVIGKIARTTLMPNRPISTNHVRVPDVVKVNQPAMLIYRTGRLTITAEVMPLNSAKTGERVRVRNTRTGVIVSGTARADGTIETGTGR